MGYFYMVRIRLARGGFKKNPFYSIVVTDSRKPRNGGFIERVGFFNAVKFSKNTGLFINLNKVQYWIGRGAQPSDRVVSLIKKIKSFKKNS